MKLSELFLYCREQDISLSLVDGSVRVKAPEGELTEALLVELKAHKAAIVEYLSSIQHGEPLPSTAAPEMSYNQRRLWFIEQIHPSNQFNLALALRWKGNVNRSLLEKALRAMLERHQVLRTAYSLHDGEPTPYLLPLEDFHISETNVSHIDDESELSECVAEEARRPFDLSQEFMLRVCFFYLSEHEQITLINMHHIATDGWSNNIFFRELTDIYNAFVGERDDPLPPLPHQYSDFAKWQKEMLSGEQLQKQLTFWKTELQGIPTVHALPLDTNRSEQRTFKGDYHLQLISEERYRRLQQLATQHEVTMYILLETAFAVLIGRYSQQHDIVVGSPVANRDQPEFQRLMGFFVNTLLIRTQWTPSTTFAELLTENRKRILDAYEYQSIPYEMLLEELGTERNLSHNAIFQVLFVLQNNDTPDDVFFQGIESEFFPFEVNISQFDLTLGAYEFDGKCSLSWGFSSDIFTRETMERFAESFDLLLDALVQNIHCPVDEVPIVPSSQLDRLQDVARKRISHPSRSETVISKVLAYGEQSPHRIAVRAGDNELTYLELINRAKMLGNRMCDSGITNGSIVAICLPRKPELSISILAVLGCGAAYVPIDPDMPVSRVSQLLQDSSADLLICEERMLTQITHCPTIVPSTSDCFDSDRGWPQTDVTHADLAYINFTSGTTGKPKGVRVSHGNLYHYCCAAQHHYRITSSDRILQTSSLSFDASIEEHFMALVHGACVVYRDDYMLASWDQFNAFLHRHDITVAGLPTALWNELSAEVDESAVPPAPSLRLIILGGEALTSQRLRRWKKAIGEQVQLLNTYGPTETTIVATVYDTVRWKPGGTVPIGQALESHRCYVLDEKRQQVPDGVVGELCIAGEAVTQGYLNESETETSFLTVAVTPGLVERVYCTGDQVRLNPDGYFEYLGRNDQQIKLRGFRIEPTEVEGMISQCAGIHQVRVQVYEDSHRGKVLVAYVVQTKVSATLDSQIKKDVQDHINKHLPEYMRPASVIVIDSIPLTLQGKLDQNQLPTPEFTSDKNEQLHEVETETQKLILGIWCELFAVDSVGLDTGFFDIGGHSLLAVKLITNIEKKTGTSLSIRDVFEHPTIRQLALMIENYKGKTNEWVDLQQELAHFESYWSAPSLEEDEGGSIGTLARNRSIKDVMLTGCTGFVGAYLLHEVLTSLPSAKVHCLVRAKDVNSGITRVADNLRRFDLWQSSYASRLHIVLGDLEKPDAGIDAKQWKLLSKDLDWIIHNGAYVNHLLPYKALKPINVDGTAALLRLASIQHNKLFSFVSATGALNPFKGEHTLTEKSLLENQRHREESGYAASKWVAEALVLDARKRGVPSQIFRLGRVSAHSTTGHCAKDDILARYLLSCQRMGIYPNEDKLEKMIPVDTVAKAIVELSINNTENSSVYHLVGQDILGWNEILRYSNWRVESVSYSRWLHALGEYSQSRNPLPFSPYWLGMKQEVEIRKSKHDSSKEHQPFTISQLETEVKMGEVGIAFPSLDKRYCKQYLSMLTDQ